MPCREIVTAQPTLQTSRREVWLVHGCAASLPWWLYCHVTFWELQLITFEKLKIDRQKKQIRHTIFFLQSENLSFGRCFSSKLSDCHRQARNFRWPKTHKSCRVSTLSHIGNIASHGAKQYRCAPLQLLIITSYHGTSTDRRDKM